MTGYAVIIHQPGDHSDIVSEHDDFSSACDSFYETIQDDWCTENDVEGVELLEWDKDTILWHSFID